MPSSSLLDKPDQPTAALPLQRDARARCRDAAHPALPQRCGRASPATVACRAGDRQGGLWGGSSPSERYPDARQLVWQFHPLLFCCRHERLALPNHVVEPLQVALDAIALILKAHHLGPQVVERAYESLPLSALPKLVFHALPDPLRHFVGIVSGIKRGLDLSGIVSVAVLVTAQRAQPNVGDPHWSVSVRNPSLQGGEG